MGVDRSDVDADVNEAYEATSTQTGIEVGAASIPAPLLGWGKGGCGFGIEVIRGRFVMFAQCPVYPQQQTLPHKCEEPAGSNLGRGAFAAQWLSRTTPRALSSRPIRQE